MSAFSILGIALALVAIVLVSIPGRGRVADPAFEDPMTWPDTWTDGWTEEVQPTAPDGTPVMAPPISLALPATTAQGRSKHSTLLRLARRMRRRTPQARTRQCCSRHLRATVMTMASCAYLSESSARLCWRSLPLP